MASIDHCETEKDEIRCNTARTSPRENVEKTNNSQSDGSNLAVDNQQKQKIYQTRRNFSKLLCSSGQKNQSNNHLILVREN